jgi:hypothetical protein
MKFDSEVIMPLFVRNYSKYVIKKSDKLADALVENFSDDSFDALSDQIQKIERRLIKRNQGISEVESKS